MIFKKKKLPVWLLVIIDLLVIAAYTVGFYGIYYLTPRELDSTGIKINQVTSINSTQNSINDTNQISKEETSQDSQESIGVTTNTASSSDSLASKFAEHFTDTVVSTENSYSSDDISISVQQYIEGSGNSQITYYVADIYIADITCLQTGFADNSYGVGYTDALLEMDESMNAILAMNGDYYGNGSNGVVIRNGEVYRSDVNDSDVCVLYSDGTMKTYTSSEFNIDDAIANGAWQAWCFGPELLDENGNSMTDFNISGHVAEDNPRSALGYYEPGHYCMVVVDGRQRDYSAGMDLEQLSNLFENLGCTAAYNMDGGKSSVMTYNDDYVNQPVDGGREISDCIVIKEND